MDDDGHSGRNNTSPFVFPLRHVAESIPGGVETMVTLASLSRDAPGVVLLEGGENGLGEGDFSKYFLNVLADYKSGEEPLQPSAAALSAQLRLRARDQLPRVCAGPGLPSAD
jgi:hypothetical protein